MATHQQAKPPPSANSWLAENDPLRIVLLHSLTGSSHISSTIYGGRDEVEAAERMIARLKSLITSHAGKKKIIFFLIISKLQFK